MISSGELRRWLIEHIAEVCELDQDELDIHRPLEEYGLSSRDAVELSGELEELLDRALSTTLLWEHPTIDQLASALASPEITSVQPEPVFSGDLSTNEATSSSAAPDSAIDEPIAVVGLSCRLPGGVQGAQDFWRLLMEERNAISQVPGDRWATYDTVPEHITRWGGFLEDIAGFDAEYFGIAPREAATMDPQQRMLLEVTSEALEHAGIAPKAIRGSKTGVFVGISGTEYGSLALADLTTVDAWVGTGAALSIAANRLSYVFDLRGPSMSVDTACSSSLTSVHLAVQSLRSGESELALAGGANLLLGPGITANFDQMGISSEDGQCKPFSADANGIARAEGAGVVVLKRLTDAQRDGDRVLAIIRGSSTNSDGRSNGLTAPNPEAQKEMLRQAYHQTGIDPSTVDYVEAHGTGTLLGDPIEASALGAVLGAGRSAHRPLLIGSAKSNIGHLEAAAGIVGLIKVVLSLHYNQIPASLNYSAPNPHIDFTGLNLSVVDTTQPWVTSKPIAGVSGFGFGGTNTHVILEKAPIAAPTEETSQHHRFLISAASPDRLADTAGRLADWVEHEGEAKVLADIDYTLARRLDGNHRAAVVASNAQELLSGLQALSSTTPDPSVANSIRSIANGTLGTAPVFVFSGHGSQWAGMGRELLNSEPVFAAAIDRLDPLIQAEAGFSLREDLINGVNATTMDHVQPLLFGIQLALVDLWASYDIRPSAVIGHSFGEVAAAVVAGALTEAAGARIIALRSRLLASLAGDGAMALLELGAEETGELVDGLSDVDIAVLSAPNQTVIAGDATQVRRIAHDVDSRGLLAKLVKLDVAAHSPIVDRVTDTLVDGLDGLQTHETTVYFYSTALADPRQQPEFDATYWATNLRQPVRFSGAVAAAWQDGHRGFIEISPHPVLRHALTDNLTALGKPEALILSSLRNEPDAAAYFHRQLALWEISRDPAPHRTAGSITNLPTKPWRHLRHWLPESTVSPAPTRVSGPVSGLTNHVEIPHEGKHLWLTDLGWRHNADLAKFRLNDPLLVDSLSVTDSIYREVAQEATSFVTALTKERLTVTKMRIHHRLPVQENLPVTIALTTVDDRVQVAFHTKSITGTWVLHADAELTTEPTELTAEQSEAKLREPGAKAQLQESQDLPAHDLRSLTPEQSRKNASHQLRTRIAGILGYAVENLNLTAPLTALGVDSLMAVRIRNAVEHDFAVAVPVSLLLRGASIEEAETWLFSELDISSNLKPDSLVSSVIKVGPRDAAERLVAAAWQEILDDDVSVTADFYELGGNSAQATRITELLEERSGRVLTTAELFAQPSIERMAGFVREDTSGGPLRVLRAGGTQPPLFFCHPAGGDTAVYRQLAQLLDADVPVYGLDRLEGVFSVEDRAKGYLSIVREVQPHGPYRFVGWSFGGAMAIELAHQLQGIGEEVALVAMLDTILPLPNTTGLSDVELLEKRFEHFKGFLESSYGKKIDLPFERMARLDPEGQADLLADTMLAEGLIDEAVSGAILEHQRTSFVDARAMELYQPSRYSEVVVFFSPTERESGGLHDQRFDRTDPARGWDEVCDDLEVIKVSGHHLSLLDPPNVEQIAHKLDEILGRTRVATSTPGQP